MEQTALLFAGLVYPKEAVRAQLGAERMRRVKHLVATFFGEAALLYENAFVLDGEFGLGSARDEAEYQNAIAIHRRMLEVRNSPKRYWIQTQLRRRDGATLQALQ